MGLPADMVRRMRDEAGIVALEARVAALVPPGVLEARLAKLEARAPAPPAVDADVERRIAALEEWQDNIEEVVVAARRAQDELRKRLDALEAPVAIRTSGLPPVREAALPPPKAFPLPPIIPEKPKGKKERS